MSGSLKLGLTIILVVVAVGIAIKLLHFIISAILGILIPAAALGLIGFILYTIFSKKSLGGGRRYLP